MRSERDPSGHAVTPDAFPKPLDEAGLEAIWNVAWSARSPALKLKHKL